MRSAPLIYPTSQSWLDASQKRVLLLGMSGLGKTFIANMLRAHGGWFHYSVDYRIGTRYMGEHIADNAKAEAMKVPFLRELLLSDSIFIGSNITFDNLAPLSTYLGKPGNPDKGGLPFEEYLRRQELHRQSEVSALLDTVHFINRARRLYGYDHFMCDSSGSICEVVDPWDAEDPVLTALSQHCLLVWIEGSDAHTEELVRRFDRAPKPMYYQRQFLEERWDEYLSENKMAEAEVDPDTFVRWTYAKALAHRQPRYRQIAQWGVTVAADDIAAVSSPDAFDRLIAHAIAQA